MSATSAMVSQDIFRLDGCTAFVSGAAGHLGRVMARALCKAGAHVILNGRDPDRLMRLENALRADGFSVASAAFDVGDAPAARRFFSGLARLDVLVNNAVSMTVRPFDALSPEDFATTYASSVTAAFEAARAAQPALKTAAAQAGEARIVNIASMYGTVAPDARNYSSRDGQSPFHYGPAKAALIQLTRHLAAELGPDHIRVNALAPGPFPQENGDPELVRALGARTMLGRVGRAAEIAGPLLFLASPASSFVTGTVLAADGGWTAW